MEERKENNNSQKLKIYISVNESGDDVNAGYILRLLGDYNMQLRSEMLSIDCKAAIMNLS